MEASVARVLPCWAKGYNYGSVVGGGEDGRDRDGSGGQDGGRVMG